MPLSSTRSSIRSQARRSLRFEGLECRRLLAGDCFQNPLDASDVNNDGALSLTDLRLMITDLSTDVQAEGEHVQQFLDVNGDGNVTLGDLRVMLTDLYTRIDEANLDELVRNIVDVAQHSDTVADLIANWQSGPGETIAETIDQLLAGQSDRIAELRQELEAHFLTDDALLVDLREQLHQLASSGLENAGGALDQVRADLQSWRTQLRQQTEQLLQNHLNGDRLRERLGAFLDGIGLQDLRSDISSFLDEVESGAIQLTDPAQQLVDLFTSTDLHFSLATLRNLDVEQFRTGIVDLLTAYENSGRALPPLAVELRDELAGGGTLLSFFIAHWSPLLGGLPGLNF
ncbi:MAG: hypothetical protein KDB14_25400 [Planctomycetales bacterium]|nr:hypothetical protein [Planctomycetales bacterium]